MSSHNFNKIQPFGLGSQLTLKLMSARLGNLDIPIKYYPDTVDNANNMAIHLQSRGGFPQQERMVRDKRKSLDKATLYSYQACRIKKIQQGNEDGQFEGPLVRALINPDKNKFDYDNKILSVGFEHNFSVGDVFSWDRTNSYWLIILQDLDEIAYFRGEIRRCDYQIHWLDENGEKHNSFASIRGPVETKINYIQKHGVSVDTPNHSLHIYMPRNPETMKQFKRYSKFYLNEADSPDNKICWRVEATDSISTVGILEITAVEYYANETEDDIENGLVKANIEKIKEPEYNPITDIKGPGFIKPKIEYEYLIDNESLKGDWFLENIKTPVTLNKFKTERGVPGVRLKWNSSQSGQFTLCYGIKEKSIIDFSKTVVVESLF